MKEEMLEFVTSKVHRMKLKGFEPDLPNPSFHVNQAYYTPREDLVGYTLRNPSWLIHELAHATGHSSRLGRALIMTMEDGMQATVISTET